MRSTKKVLFLFLSPLVCVPLFATNDNNGEQPYSANMANTQQVAKVQVSGKVLDTRGEPLAGVRVAETGTGNGTITNNDGIYRLDVSSNATLTFSYIGFRTVVEPLNGRRAIDITLQEDLKELDEVVVVGYGTQKKVNLTGAVSTISGKELSKRPINNAAGMLQGQVPGLRIVQGLGQPGAENISIRVRGQGTYSSAGSDPLVLIDGVPGSLSRLNPNDIENISILKDAASAAIYGARAANGVILVTTKTGDAGGFKVSYTGVFARHTPTRMLDLVTNSAEYMRLYNEANKNSGIVNPTSLYSEEQIAMYENATDRTQYPNFDWLGEMFKPAFVHTQNLSVSGGGKSTSYNISLGLGQQPGTMKGFKYDKYNFRANIKSELNNRLTIGANLGLENSKREQPRQGQSDAFLSTLAQAPTYAPKRPDGKYVDKAFAHEKHNKNMVAIIDNGVLRNDDVYGLNAQLWAEIKPAKGLTIHAKFAANYTGYEVKDVRPQMKLYNFHTGEFSADLDVGGKGLTSQANRDLYTNFFAYAKYETQWKDAHDLGIQIGYNNEYDNYRTLWGQRQNYVIETLTELDAGTQEVQNAGGNTTEWAIRSGFARLNYNYKERYLLEANLRYDGSSRISKAKRWGFFPSFSLGWRLTEEEWAKKALPHWISDVKIRASYGVLGNQNIGLYPYQAMLAYTGAYSFDNKSLTPGVAQLGLNNENIKWESTSVSNVGLDLTFFNRLNITYEVYYKHTYDILRGAQVNDLVGLWAPTINKGEMVNFGHELNVQYRNEVLDGPFEGLAYGGGFYFDIFRNKLVNFGTREIGGREIREDNLPYNSYYMLEMIGIFQNEKEIANSPKQFNDKVSPGDFKYRDANGDGIINDEDRVVIPGRFPKFEYSFNGNLSWKGADFTFLFQGVQGRRVYTDGWGLDPFMQGTPPTKEYAKNRWTKDGDGNDYPRLYFGNNGNSQNTRANSWYLQDASFLRLKNVTLGYTLPTKWSEKVGLSLVRLYFAGDNLLTFTKYKGLDPERSGDGRFAEYPQNKILSIGVNIEF